MERVSDGCLNMSRGLEKERREGITSRLKSGGHPAKSTTKRSRPVSGQSSCDSDHPIEWTRVLANCSFSRRSYSHYYSSSTARASSRSIFITVGSSLPTTYLTNPAAPAFSDTLSQLRRTTYHSSPFHCYSSLLLFLSSLISHSSPPPSRSL